jgi:hypothetical protein
MKEVTKVVMNLCKNHEKREKEILKEGEDYEKEYIMTNKDKEYKPLLMKLLKKQTKMCMDHMKKLDDLNKGMPSKPTPAPAPAPKPVPKKATPTKKPKGGLSTQKINFSITDIKSNVEKEIIKWIKENANLSEKDYKKMIIKFIQKRFVDKAYDILEPNETNLSTSDYNKIEEFISNLRSDLRDFADNRFKK